MKLKEKLANAKTYVQQNQRKFILMMCSIVVVGGIVAGTLAWLAARTNPVINNFIGSNLTIDLQETTDEYAMIPGDVIEKNPTVTVEAGSEACWLFLQVKESVYQANGSGITVDIAGNSVTRTGDEYKYLDYDIIPHTVNEAEGIDIGWNKIGTAEAESLGLPVKEGDIVVNTYYYRTVGKVGTALEQAKTYEILTLDSQNVTEDTKNKVKVNEYIINSELNSQRLEDYPVTITFTPIAIQQLGFSEFDSAVEQVLTLFK